jgi:8-oxo-dGTP pyrophosphatase MutT (NUDIX family)
MSMPMPASSSGRNLSLAGASAVPDPDLSRIYDRSMAESDPTAEGTPRPKRRRRRRGAKRRAAAATTAQPAKATERSDTAASKRKRSRRKGAAARSRSATAAAATSKRSRKRKAAARRKPSRPSVPTKREISAGGVVYRRDGDAIEVVLASRRTRKGQLAWGLAKGGIEDDESMEDAAIREVREETGIEAEIEESLGETRYMYVWEDVRIRKTVHFFLMRFVADSAERDDEMEEIRWFPLERALKRAAYRGERDMLQRAAELLR